MNKITLFLKSKFPVFMFWCGKKKCLLSTLFYRNNPKKWSIKKYKKKYGETLNIDSPCSFYEKINYLKIYYHDDRQTLLSDKYRVKKVLENENSIKIPKALFASENVRDLKRWFKENKDRISKFVIKNNHSCGDIFIYKNGIFTRKYGVKIKSFNKVYRMIKIAMKYNHYYTCFERNYKDIKPVVFVEEFIEMDNAVEYEFMANYGQIIFVNVVENRQTSKKSEILVDPNFNLINPNEKPTPKPKHLFEMKSFIERYSNEFPFCRVDFIENDDNVYFCEFTFIKSGGIGTLGSKELNQSLGKLLDIDNLIKKSKTV